MLLTGEAQHSSIGVTDSVVTTRLSSLLPVPHALLHEKRAAAVSAYLSLRGNLTACPGMARCAFVTIFLALALFCIVAPTSGDKCAPPPSDPADHTFCSRRYFTMPRVQYGGPLSQSLDAFHWYNPAQLFDGKSLQDYFRFSVVWWHTFLGDGRDIFGGGSKNFPWHVAADPMQRARDTVDAAFELFEVLGVKFYAFHDRDVAPTAFLPDGRIDLDATNANLMEIVRYMKTKQEQTGVKVLWGTANLFSHRVYATLICSRLHLL